MKKSIKAIAAAISASVMAAVPMAGALTSNAAGSFTQYSTNRTYYLSNTDESLDNTSRLTLSNRFYNMNVISAANNCYSNPDYNAAFHYAGSIRRGTIAGSIIGNNSSLTSNKVNFNFDPAEGSLDKKGIIASVTYTYTGSNPYVNGIVKKNAINQTMSQVSVQTVRVGDTTKCLGYGNGISVGDASCIQQLVNTYGQKYTEAQVTAIMNEATGQNRPFYLDCNDIPRYTKALYIGEVMSAGIDNTLYSNGAYTESQILSALLASDINGDGWVTDADATAIMKVFSNPDRYKDITYFYGFGDYDTAHM